VTSTCEVACPVRRRPLETVELIVLTTPAARLSTGTAQLRLGSSAGCTARGLEDRQFIDPEYSTTSLQERAVSTLLDVQFVVVVGQLSLLPSAGREMSSIYGYGMKA